MKVESVDGNCGAVNSAHSMKCFFVTIPYLLPVWASDFTRERQALSCSDSSFATMASASASAETRISVGEHIKIDDE